MERKGCLVYLGMVCVVWGIAILCAFVFSYFAMLLWNYVMVSLFGLCEVTYWQMLALQILVRLFAPYQIDTKK